MNALVWEHEKFALRRSAAALSMILEHLLSWLVRHHLRDFVDDFSASNVDLHFRDGRVLLQDVTLSPTMLAQLALPLATERRSAVVIHKFAI